MFTKKREPNGLIFLSRKEEKYMIAPKVLGGKHKKCITCFHLSHYPANESKTQDQSFMNNIIILATGILARYTKHFGIKHKVE